MLSRTDSATIGAQGSLGRKQKLSFPSGVVLPYVEHRGMSHCPGNVTRSAGRAEIV